MVRHKQQKQKQKGGKEKLAKKPRKGLDSIKKRAKKPSIPRAIPSSSATRKTKRAPTSNVVKDTEEVAKFKKRAKRTRSLRPIEERLSRLCLSPQSPPRGLAEEDELEEVPVMIRTIYSRKKGWVFRYPIYQHVKLIEDRQWHLEQSPDSSPRVKMAREKMEEMNKFVEKYYIERRQKTEIC